MASEVVDRDGRHRTRIERAAPWIAVAGVLWVALGAISVAWTKALGWADCARRDADSTYGDVRWQAWPPGHSCVFEAVDGLPAMRTGPAWSESVALGLVPLATVAAIAGSTVWVISKVRSGQR